MQFIKKLSLSIIFLLLSVNLFANNSLKLVEQKKSKNFNITYSIYEDVDKTSILVLSDDTNDNKEVRFFIDNVSDGHTCLLQCEKLFNDLYNKVINTKGVEFFNKINSYPMFTFTYLTRYELGLAKDPDNDKIFNILNLRTRSLDDNIIWENVFYTYYQCDLDKELSHIDDEYEWYSDVYNKTSSKDNTVISVLECGDEDRYKDFWDTFGQRYKDITVIRKIVNYDNYQAELSLCKFYNTLPDILYMWPNGASFNIHQNHLTKDLTSFIEEYNLESNFPSCTLNPLLQQGKYLAYLPLDITVTNCLYVNKTVLSKCGLKPAKNYKELKKQAKKARSKGYNLIAMGNDYPWVLQNTLFSLICGRYMGEEWAEDILTGKETFSSEGFKKALTMLKTMIKDKVLSLDTFTSTYQYLPQYFSDNTSCYMIDGDWRAGAFVTDYRTGTALLSKERQKEDIEIIPFPSLLDENYEDTSSGVLGPGYGISSFVKDGSLEEQQCYTILSAIYSREAMKYRKSVNHFPFIKEDVLIDEEPIFMKRADFYSDIKTLTPVLDSSFPSAVSEMANELLRKLCFDEVSIDEVCSSLDEALHSLREQ